MCNLPGLEYSENYFFRKKRKYNQNMIYWVGDEKQFIINKYPSVKVQFEVFVAANISCQKMIIYNSEETFDMINCYIRNFRNSRNAASEYLI